MGIHAFGGGRGSGTTHLAVYVVYIVELLLVSAAPCRGWLLGSISFVANRQRQIVCQLSALHSQMFIAYLLQAIVVKFPESWFCPCLSRSRGLGSVSMNHRQPSRSKLLSKPHVTKALWLQDIQFLAV